MVQLGRASVPNTHHAWRQDLSRNAGHHANSGWVSSPNRSRRGGRLATEPREVGALHRRDHLPVDRFSKRLVGGEDHFTTEAAKVARADAARRAATGATAVAARATTAAARSAATALATAATTSAAASGARRSATTRAACAAADSTYFARSTHNDRADSAGSQANHKVVWIDRQNRGLLLARKIVELLDDGLGVEHQVVEKLRVFPRLVKETLKAGHTSRGLLRAATKVSGRCHSHSLPDR